MRLWRTTPKGISSCLFSFPLAFIYVIEHDMSTETNRKQTRTNTLEVFLLLLALFYTVLSFKILCLHVVQILIYYFNASLSHLFFLLSRIIFFENIGNINLISCQIFLYNTIFSQKNIFFPRLSHFQGGGIDSGSD